MRACARVPCLSVLDSRPKCRVSKGPGAHWLCPQPHAPQFSRSDVTRRAAVIPLIELEHATPPYSNQTCRDAVCAVKPGMSRVEQKNHEFRRRANNCPEFRASAVFDPRGLHCVAGGANTVMTAAVVNSVSVGLQFLRYSEKITGASWT